MHLNYHPSLHLMHLTAPRFSVLVAPSKHYCTTHGAFIHTELLLLIELNYRALIYPSPSDIGAEKIPLVTMGGRAKGQACADP